MSKKSEKNSHVVDDLIGFLKSTNVELRRSALEHVKGLTGSEDGVRLLKYSGGHNALLPLISSEDERTAADALTSLVNLTSDEEVCVQLLKEGILRTLIEVIGDEKKDNLLDLHVMLLSNLTRCDAAKEYSEGKGALAKHLLGASHEKAPHVPFVMMNVTATEDGRKLLASERKALERMLPFLSHPNPTLRHGAAGLLKNCLFQEELHEWALSPSIDVLVFVLLPLVVPNSHASFSQQELQGFPLRLRNRAEGKEEKAEGAVTEEDQTIVCLLLECLVLLGRTRRGRDDMRAKQVYPVVREMHKRLEARYQDRLQEAVVELIGCVVDMLVRDEGAEEDERAFQEREAAREKREKEAKEQSAKTESDGKGATEAKAAKKEEPKKPTPQLTEDDALFEEVEEIEESD